MKTLDDFNFYDKKVLVRADLNSDVVNGRVVKSLRIYEASKTISELKRRGARVVVIAHQGRVGKDDFVSLRGHARFLNKYVRIKFVEDVVGEKAVRAVEKLKIGEAVLLENVRFEKDEFKPEKGRKNKLINELVPLFDIYVNDAFSVCHRKHTSIVGFPKYLPSCGGRLLEKEVKALKKLGKFSSENVLFILGGAKPEDNIKLLKGGRVLSCGLFGQTCLSSKGFKFGAQEKYLRGNIEGFSGVKKELKRRLRNVETPVDFAVKIRGKRRELKLDEFPSEYEIFDIGHATVKEYISEIKKAKAIFMKGPAGDCSNKRFCYGTYKLLSAVSKSKGFTVIGGGHLSDAFKKCRINCSRVGHISLSGGALLRYIAGERLVGLKVLERRG